MLKMARNGKGVSKAAYVGGWTAAFAVLLAIMNVLTSVLSA